MSVPIGNLHHPLTKQPEKIYEGFSWPVLLFSFIWYFYKGMYKWSVISFIVVYGTLGIGGLVFPFYSNKQYTKHLLENGYLPDSKTRTALVQRGLITESHPTINEDSVEENT